MKYQIRALLSAVLFTLAATGLSAGDSPSLAAPPTVSAVPPSEASAKEGYPLTTCVVSGQPLEGGMGGPVDYIHKAPGQPDRLVRFCCKACIAEFKKDPAKYLAKIDAAAAAAKPAPQAELKP